MNWHCALLTIGHMAKMTGLGIGIAVGFIILVFGLASGSDYISEHTPKRLKRVLGSLAALISVAILSALLYVWFMYDYAQQCPFSPAAIAWTKAHPPIKNGCD